MTKRSMMVSLPPSDDLLDRSKAAILCLLRGEGKDVRRRAYKMSGLPIARSRDGTHGVVALRGPTPVVAGMSGAWTIAYRAPTDGLPAGSALAWVRRWPSDWDIPQTGSPEAPGYTTIAIEPERPCRWRTRRSLEWHPFDHVFELEFPDGLPGGATVSIVTRGRAQTFIEEECPLSVRLRPGDGAWVEIAVPTVAVIAADAASATLIVPSDVGAGEEFEIACRVEDIWGNPADLAVPPELIGIDAEPLPDLPGVKRWRARIAAPGTHRLSLTGELGACLSNPIRVHPTAPTSRLVWGDIHAQSLVGCGARTVEAFFRHARDFARMDFASHQANCFLVSGPEWRETETVTASFDAPGKFVGLLGLEWSADTALGGDRNLYFPGDAATITRCSHEYVDDKSDAANDLPTAEDLHAKYRNSDVVIGLHVGGRTTDLSKHEPSVERLIEVHSTHATSEWFLFEALRRGYRMGVTAGSDGVDGRPGASHPGHQSVRNCRGGLVAVPVATLDRPSILAALRARNCYATNGARIALRYSAGGHAMGSEFDVKFPPLLSIEIDGTGPLEAIDIFRGVERIHSVEPHSGAPLSDRLRIAWRGASAPGNFMRARMNWDGHATLSAGVFHDPEGYAFDTPDEGIVESDAMRIAWRSATGGDWDGVIARVDAPNFAVVAIDTPQISVAVPLARLREGPVSFADTRPERELALRFLPADLGPSSWRGELRDPTPRPGWNAYWFRVRQWDGAIAWSSPIFARLPG
jgi:hypothetical protein